MIEAKQYELNRDNNDYKSQNFTSIASIVS